MIQNIIAGNVCKDAETRTAGNSTVTGTSVAAETGFGDRKQTHFYSISIWGKRGESLAQYLTKGTKVTVIGEFSEREYNGKQYKEINVSEIVIQGGGQGRPDVPQQQSPVSTDEDIPF